MVVYDGLGPMCLHLVLGEVHDRGLVVDPNEDHVRQDREVLPRDLDAALGGQVPVVLEVDRELSSTVDGHVVPTVGAGAGVAELGSVEDADHDTCDWITASVDHPTADNRSAPRFDVRWVDANLYGVVSRVEELRGHVDGGRLGVGGPSTPDEGSTNMDIILICLTINRGLAE